MCQIDIFFEFKVKYFSKNSLMLIKKTIDINNYQ